MTQFISGFTKSDTFPCLINSLIAVFDVFFYFWSRCCSRFCFDKWGWQRLLLWHNFVGNYFSRNDGCIGIFTVFKKVKVFDPSKSLFMTEPLFFRRNVLITREIWKNNNKTRPAFSRTGLGLTEFKFAFLREIKRSRERLRERKREKRNNFKPEWHRQTRS